MDTQTYDRIGSLKNMAENKSIKTKIKVKKAIADMENNNIVLTFQAVAKVAKVSKTWIYNDKEISEHIRENRSKNPAKNILNNLLIINSKNKKVDTLQKRIAMMASEIDDLKNQLETVYAELYKL